jgi:hypothetical protein
MIWTFERQGESLNCEIRRDVDADAYEFVLTRPDGSHKAERFDDASAVIARSVDVMRGLIEDGWRSPTLDPAAEENM